MFGKFKLKGNRVHIRTDEELADIDGALADEAFGKYKKNILDEYFITNGFIKYKSNSYVRKNKVDVLEYLDLQKERHGSKTFTINVSIMPLYVPHDYVVIGFGDRLGKFICNKDIWWDYANDDIAYESFQNVKEAIDRFVLPWFNKYSDEKCLMEKLLEDKKNSKRTGIGVSYKNEEWINALKESVDRTAIIADNVSKLKLPKKILKG